MAVDTTVDPIKKDQGKILKLIRSSSKPLNAMELSDKSGFSVEYVVLITSFLKSDKKIVLKENMDYVLYRKGMCTKCGRCD
jgi:hypothetical protein